MTLPTKEILEKTLLEVTSEAKMTGVNPKIRELEEFVVENEQTFVSLQRMRTTSAYLIGPELAEISYLAILLEIFLRAQDTMREVEELKWMEKLR